MYAFTYEPRDATEQHLLEYYSPGLDDSERESFDTLLIQTAHVDREPDLDVISFAFIMDGTDPKIIDRLLGFVQKSIQRGSRGQHVSV